MKINKTKDLSDFQEKVLSAFGKINRDVKIEELYNSVYGTGSTPYSRSVRSMQQKLGPTFAAINTKLKGARIAPGETKRTYRIYTGE